MTMKTQQSQRRLYSLTAGLSLLFLTLPTINDIQNDGSAGGLATASPTSPSFSSVSDRSTSGQSKNPYSILNRFAASLAGDHHPSKVTTTGEKKAQWIQKRSPAGSSTEDQKEAQRQRNLYSAYEAIVNSDSQLPLFLQQRHKKGSKRQQQQQQQQRQKQHQHQQPSSTERSTAKSSGKAKTNSKKKSNLTGAVDMFSVGSWNRRQRKLETDPEKEPLLMEESRTAVEDKVSIPLKALFESVFGSEEGATDDDKVKAKAVAAELIEESKNTKVSSSLSSIGDRIVDDLSQFMNVESVADAKAAIESLAAAAKEMYSHPPTSLPFHHDHKSESGSGAIKHAIEHLAEAVAAAAASAAGGGRGELPESPSKTTLQKDLVLSHTVSKESKTMRDATTIQKEDGTQEPEKAIKTGVTIINDQEYEPHHCEMEDVLGENHVHPHWEDHSQDEEQVYEGKKGSVFQESDGFLAYYMHKPDPMATFWKQVLTTSAIVLSAFLSLLLLISYKMYARNQRREAHLRFGDEDMGRSGSSPLAFFHYITLGIFAWPATLSNSIRLPNPTAALSCGSASSSAAASSSLSTKVRRRSSLSLSLLVGTGSSEKSLLPEPVVAKSASSVTNCSGGPIMSGIRRTSASHHMQHFQQAQEQYQTQQGNGRTDY